MKKIEVKQFDIDEINGITLLSVEEAQKVPESILSCGKWWWLRSTGYAQDFAAYVSFDGDIRDYGNLVYCVLYAVRPAFRINNLKSEIGDKILINKTWCTVIDKGLALADYSICKHRFDSESNDWETSEIKRFINSDEFKAMI